MAQTNLTPALEDYLETIYLLQQKNNEARVREIAKDRNVKASSVSLALKRLSELGLIRYEQREMIQLTDEGKIAARRVYARHVVLFQFFRDILGMDDGPAREEACGLEHALSDEGMDRFVRFFETISMCPTKDVHCLISQHRAMKAAQDAGIEIDHTHACSGCASCNNTNCQNNRRSEPIVLSHIPDTATIKVLKVTADGDTRQKLIETGILPNVEITRLSRVKDRINISIDGNLIALTEEEANAILGFILA